MKRFFCILAVLLLLPLTLVHAEKGAHVIDRITDPTAEPDFSFAPDAELLEIIFPQILNSDAALLRCGGHAILMDCSSAHQSGRVLSLLRELNVTHLDAVINSHPHYDHLQGLEAIASQVQVDELLVSFPLHYNKHMIQAEEVCRKLGIPIRTYGDMDTYTLGGTTLTAWCKGDDDWNANELSAIWKVQLGKATALFTGDAMLKTQLRLLETVPAKELDIDILKYPHHGLNKLNEDFYNATTPKFAVITNNGTKPQEAKYFLKLKRVPMAFTVPGYVSLTTDGETWLIQRITPGTIVNENTYADDVQEE